MQEEEPSRTLLQNGLFFAAMTGILVFANWGRPESADGIWHVIYTNKWLVTAVFWTGLCAALAAWFSIKTAYLAPVFLLPVVLGIVFPGYPAVAFTAGFAGLALILGFGGGEQREWLKGNVDAVETDTPAAARRGTRVRAAARQAGRRGDRAVGMGRRRRRRKFTVGEPLRIGRRGAHVFRHADRGADPAGADRKRHGKRSSARAVARRARAVAAEHARDSGVGHGERKKRSSSSGWSSSWRRQAGCSTAR